MKRRRKIIIAVAIVSLLGAFLASTMIVAYTDRAYICENTASQKGYREWIIGIKTQKWYIESELERFLDKEYPDKLNHRWTSYKGDGQSLLPGIQSKGHGRPGPILHLDIELLNEAVKKQANDQNLRLYKIFTTGNSDEVEAAISEIYFGP